MTYAELVRLEATLSGAIARGAVAEDGPAAPAVATALRLAPGRTHGHALRVAREDRDAIEDVVRGSNLGRTRPVDGDELDVGDER